MAGAIFEEQIQRIPCGSQMQSSRKGRHAHGRKADAQDGLKARHGHGQNSWEKSWDITDFSDQTKVSRWENQW